MFQAAKSLDDALAAVTDGCMVVVPREVSGVPMAATRALIRRGVKRLHLVALPTSSLQADLQLPAIMAQMTCEIQYCTAGTQTNAGLDRGRTLEEMDYEVLKLLYPYSAQKMNYTQNPAAALETMVFWSEPAFTPIVTLRDRLSRTAKVTVFAFQELGEQ